MRGIVAFWELEKVTKLESNIVFKLVKVVR